MKIRLSALALAAALALSLLAGCSGGGAGATSAKTPEELTQLYASAITDNGGEQVEYNPVISQVSEEDMSGMVLETAGLNQEDMTAFGISMSLMNVQAYGIAAVMPAEGREDAVKEALQGYIDRQKQSFENYLADQYAVAESARLETLSDGTVLMVMCQDQDTVFDAISKAIEEG